MEKITVVYTNSGELDVFKIKNASIKTPATSENIRAKIELSLNSNDTSLIAAIIGVYLHEQIRIKFGTRDWGTIELIASAAEKVFTNQSIKPDAMEWAEYCDTIGLSDWEEWVIREAKGILQLS